MNTDYSSLKNEYDELSKKIVSPERPLTSGEFKILSSRMAQLRPIVELIDLLEKYNSDLNDTQEMLPTLDDKDMIDLAQQEIITLKQKISDTATSLNELQKTTDPNDVRNVILEIRAGTGGEEAALFAADLFRMYSKYAESQGWKVSLLNSNQTGNGGFKEIVTLIEGENVFGKLKFENGVHRVQRIPATESSGRIHTSAVSVVALPEVDDVNIEINNEDLRIDVYRAGGPGGQSVNTTDSAVRITHIPTGIIVTCQDEKSQHKNKARALSILKSKLFEMEQAKQLETQSNLRKSAVGSGDRSAKIRTYNFPQSRVTDHRIKHSWHNLQNIIDGDLEEIIQTTQINLHTDIDED